MSLRHIRGNIKVQAGKNDTCVLKSFIFFPFTSITLNKYCFAHGCLIIFARFSYGTFIAFNLLYFDMWRVRTGFCLDVSHAF